MFEEEINIERLSRNFKEEPWKRRIDIPVESDFRYLYLELNLPGQTICDFMGMSQATLSRILRQLNLKKTREQTKACRERVNNELFGGNSPFSSRAIYEKGEKTCEKKYGYKNASKAPKIIKKRNTTNNTRYGGNSPMCSPKVKQKLKDNIREEFGEGITNVMQVPKYKQAWKDAVLEKHNVENVFQLESVKKKTEETHMKNLGVKNVSQSPLIKEKKRQTFQRTRQVDNIFQDAEFKKQMRERNMSELGVPCVAQKNIQHFEDLKKDYWEKHFIDRKGRFDVAACAAYHKIALVTVNSYKKKFAISAPSKYESLNELELKNYISSLGFSAKTDRTLLKGKELDIYVSSKKFAVEHDGILYHSQGNIHYESANRVSENYHLQKTLKCIENGVTLVHVFENEWYDTTSKNVWKTLIREYLGENSKSFERVKVREKGRDETTDEFIQKHTIKTLYTRNDYTDVLIFEAQRNTIGVAGFKYISENFVDIAIFGLVSGYSYYSFIDEIIKYFGNTHAKIALDRRMFSSKFLSGYKYECTSPRPHMFKKGDVERHVLIPEKIDKPLEELRAVGYLVVYDCGEIILES